MKPDARDGFVTIGLLFVAVGLSLAWHPWAGLVGFGAGLLYVGVKWGRV